MPRPSLYTRQREISIFLQSLGGIGCSSEGKLVPRKRSLIMAPEVHCDDVV
jgi:hypothetical protein